MRDSEARFIGSLLDGLPTEQISPLLNLGSSTLRVRQVEYPHIDREIFAPLARRGVQVIHADLKADEGVDIVGDIYDAAIQEKVRRVGAKLIICCNIMEHVTDPAGFARICGSLLAPGGSILLGEPGRQTGDAFPEWIAARGWKLERFEQPVPRREKSVRIFVLHAG